MSRKLILFDIDGTLVSRCHVHEKSYPVAIKEVFNINVERPGPRFAGTTDKKIVFTLLEESGIERNQIKKRLGEVYKVMINYVKENIDNDKEFRLLPGVKTLLEELNKRNHIIGLLTGNLEEIARIKMKKLGVNHYFSVGSFGGITEVRNELVPTAIENTEQKFNITIDKENVFVLGDTPHDIECGKANKVKTIAVATGPYSKEELLEYKPDYVFDDFTNTDRIINAIAE